MIRYHTASTVDAVCDGNPNEESWCTKQKRKKKEGREENFRTLLSTSGRDYQIWNERTSFVFLSNTNLLYLVLVDCTVPRIRRSKMNSSNKTDGYLAGCPTCVHPAKIYDFNPSLKWRFCSLYAILLQWVFRKYIKPINFLHLEHLYIENGVTNPKTHSKSLSFFNPMLTCTFVLPPPR